LPQEQHAPTIYRLSSTTNQLVDWFTRLLLWSLIPCTSVYEKSPSEKQHRLSVKLMFHFWQWWRARNDKTWFHSHPLIRPQHPWNASQSLSSIRFREPDSIYLSLKKENLIVFLFWFFTSSSSPSLPHFQHISLMS
jgi:hypothetical protein